MRLSQSPGSGYAIARTIQTHFPNGITDLPPTLKHLDSTPIHHHRRRCRCGRRTDMHSSHFSVYFYCRRSLIPVDVRVAQCDNWVRKRSVFSTWFVAPGGKSRSAPVCVRTLAGLQKFFF